MNSVTNTGNNRVATAIKALVLMLSALVLQACSHTGTVPAADQTATTPAQPAAEQVSANLEAINGPLREKWGIEIVALRLTMQGMMVDLRYKVLDATKAASLLDINTKSWLDVKKNGARLGVPHSAKVGELRQSTSAKKIKEGIDYFILFGNPGARYLSSGDEVKLVLGDLTVDSLIVQ